MTSVRARSTSTTGPWATWATFWVTSAGSSPYTFVRTALASNSTQGDVNQPAWARSNCSHAVAAGCPCSRLYTRIIVSSPHCSGGLEEEVISAHLRNLGGGGGLPASRGPCRLGGESVGEDVVPGHLGMGTDQDALVGLDQNDLVLQPEGLGPLRRKANPIPRFDHGGLGRIHCCLNWAMTMSSWGWSPSQPRCFSPLVRATCSLGGHP